MKGRRRDPSARTRDSSCAQNIQRRPARTPEQFAPLFVLAPPRSYSSVVTTMIGQHPSLVGLPELKLFAFGTVGELGDSLPSYWRERGFIHRSPGLVRALAQTMFGDQGLDSVKSALAWLKARPHWTGAHVFDALLAQLAPRTAVEKSPENVATSAALHRLASAYPKAHYLHLTRHPVANTSFNGRASRAHRSSASARVPANGWNWGVA